MLDYKKIIKNEQEYIKRLNTRQSDFSYLKKIKNLFKKRNQLIVELQKMRQENNIISNEIAKSFQFKPVNSKKIQELKNIIYLNKDKIQKNSIKQNELNNEIKKILSYTPNLPHIDCPIGKNSSDNKVIKKYHKVTKKTSISHFDIAKKLDLIDEKAAVKISGSRFMIYKNNGARIQRGLMNFILDIHHSKGYQEYQVPVLVKKESMYGTGQFPKFIDDAYITNSDLVLIPTGEVSLTNINSNRLFYSEELPQLYCAYSLCFRKEAGAAGQENRGLIRLHQFNKIELVKFVTPQNSDNELNKLLCDAKDILDKLNIPYRVIELCSGDLGFSANKTYDIEVWMPSLQKYVEISSCSSFGDFQARRMNIKYKTEDGNQFINTINGSGLALDRLMAVFIENYYNEDTNKIIIPKILDQYIKID